MEKKAKIIATLGPAISSSSQLRKMIEMGVDAFRINFSHETKGVKNIVNKIRGLEKELWRASFWLIQEKCEHFVTGEDLTN